MKFQSRRSFGTLLATKFRRLRKKYRALPDTTKLRFKGGLAVAMLAAVGLIATTQIMGAASDVTGVVFNDYNGNGKRDNVAATNWTTAVDGGVPGVTVRGFAADGTLCDTKTTDANGGFTLSMGNCAGAKYRVEFTDLPAGLNSSQVGDDSKTTVQFVAAGGKASLGVYRSEDYCQNNPKLVSSCYNFGAADGPNASKQTLVGFPFTASGTTPPSMNLGTVSQAGVTFGQAYRTTTKTLYTSALMKRHSGYGPGGSGGIYKTVVPANGSGTSAASLLVTIPNAGGDTHPVSDSNCDSRDGQDSRNSGQCWGYDEFSFDAVGKRGLGGMTMLSDPKRPSNDALLVTNLNDRQLYKVTNLDGQADATGYPMPLNLPNTGEGALPSGSGNGQHQGCEQADVRPFAVTTYKGTGYAGFVCSAQTSRDKSKMRAYVYSFNPSNMVFATAPTVEFSLDYGRSCSNGSDKNNEGCWQRANWLPWISDFSDPLMNTRQPVIGSGEKIVTAPQAELSDIAFGDNGSMTIGMRDRFGDQIGYRAFSPKRNTSQIFAGTSTGDILRACLVNGKYVMEDGGKCDGKGPGSGGVKAVVSGLPQGIGGYEFYNYDYFAGDDGGPWRHDENSFGGLTQVPGYNTVVNTAMTPLTGATVGSWSGGVRWYNSQDGTKTNSYRLYQSNPQTTNYFAKANGAGDVTQICDSAPTEIGNRVWRDTNGNGIQDANENGIPGVTVSLYAPNGTLISTAVTDNDGAYLFSNRVLDENGLSVTSTSNRKYSVNGLQPNTQGYKLVLNGASDYTNAARLQGLQLTTANATAGYANDQNDSDATPANPSDKLSVGNPATITFATAEAGANNHTFDFGFNQTVALGNFVWLDSNKNGKVDGTESTQGLNGVTVNLYSEAADINKDGSLSGSEVAGTTPIASRVTANDQRPGSSNGRPGYYQFDGLQPGNYFVSIAASNFGAGKPLSSMTDVPVPTGVGDTQDDNNNHGAVPAGGSLAANGVVSTKINLAIGDEPTSVSAKPDDDGDSNTDMTIDFGFWHAYSLGNRVWVDKNNSGTIDAEDGTNPGVVGAQVNLLDENGNFITKVHTGTGGYYRFDNLNAGTYIVEIPASNFATNGALHDHSVSSVGPGEEADPDNDVDSNDNGLTNGANQAVRSGTVTLGPGATEPTGETDLGSGGQGTDDAFANMTVDFGFVGTTSFGDTVYWDFNGNGTQDPGEPGIPNVTVDLVCSGPDGSLTTTIDNYTASMKTNANGTYLFTDLLPATCKGTVRTQDVPNGTLTTPGSFTSKVSEDKSFLEADFGFRGNGAIGNQVWKEVFKDGKYDTTDGDMGVPGVRIELYLDLNGNGTAEDTDVLVGTKTTDTNGRYQFTGLPTDDNNDANGAGAQYVVKLVDEDDKLKDLQWSQGSNPGQDNNSQNPEGYAVSLTNAAPSNQTADFGYNGIAKVGDTVFYDVNANGKQDPGDDGIKGVTVTLTYAGPDKDCLTPDDNVSRIMVTGDNGYYLFDNLLGADYCISIVPPAGTSITTNNQGEQFTLGPTQTDLTRDFGVVGDGTIGNQLFIDKNENGRFDGGDTGIAGVTVDLYRDLDGDGKVDPGSQPIKSATTDQKGEYGFSQLMTGTDTGIKYVVVVSDRDSKLKNLTYVPGNGTNADNESKDPTGYPITLTPADNHHPEADFGYKSNPTSVDPPDFWKDQQVEGQTITYTLTWINQSSVEDVLTNFWDEIPQGTTYVEGSLKCTANGTSKTNNCAYNPSKVRTEWSGTVGADPGAKLPKDAKNSVVMELTVKMRDDTFHVSNQGFGCYDDNGDDIILPETGNVRCTGVPSDNIRTPEPDDPNLYDRKPEDAAIVAATGGILANTGQAIWAGAIAAGVLIIGSTGAFLWIRRQPKWAKK